METGHGKQTSDNTNFCNFSSLFHKICSSVTTLKQGRICGKSAKGENHFVLDPTVGIESHYVVRIGTCIDLLYDRRNRIHANVSKIVTIRVLI
jgi:hypothetical protein